MKQIHIFTAGRHVALSGAAIAFSEADLAATARAYDPAKHEAPLVIGHPKLDGPAYGWVNSLSFADGLQAVPHQVDAQFAELVSAGRFKKVSASFFAPDAPANPVPGVYYLRHVGFLGATPPAVKGLKPIAFADADEGVIEFADWGDVQNASMWRRLRDFFIAQFGLEKADSVIPDYAVASLEDDARRESEDAGPAMPAYADQPQKGTTMTPEEIAAREKKLQEDQAALDRRTAEFAERDKTAKAEAAKTRRAELLAFCEGLVQSGKVLPVEKAPLVEFLAGLAPETVIEFGEGDAKASQPAETFMRTFLESIPARVDFAERGRPEADGARVEFAAPLGYTIDAERLQIHHKAVAYQAKNKVDYATAVKAVGGG